MSNLEITRNENGELVGYKQSRAFESDKKEETIFFWKCKYTWDQIIEIAKEISEYREENKTPEEAPF